MYINTVQKYFFSSDLGVYETNDTGMREVIGYTLRF